MNFFTNGSSLKAKVGGISSLLFSSLHFSSLGVLTGHCPIGTHDFEVSRLPYFLQTRRIGCNDISRFNKFVALSKRFVDMRPFDPYLEVLGTTTDWCLRLCNWDYSWAKKPIILILESLTKCINIQIVNS